MPVTVRTKHLPVENRRVPSVGVLSYLFPRSETHKHQGVDFPAPIGTPVRSVTAGIVTDSGNELTERFSGYGRFVQIEFVDPPYLPVWILYAHLDRALVKPGDTVQKGQEIGTVGNTCFNRRDPYKACGGPHLHFEIRSKQYLPSEGGRYDPTVFLAQHGEIPPNVMIQLKQEEKEVRNKASLALGLTVMALIGGAVWYLRKS